MNIPHFANSFICCRHLSCFQDENNIAVNMSIHISVWVIAFNPFWYLSRARIAGSYSYFIFNCLRNCYTIFHSSRTILHSHQQCIGFLISSHPHQYLLLCFKISIVIGVKCDFYISVMIVLLNIFACAY